MNYGFQLGEAFHVLHGLFLSLSLNSVLSLFQACVSCFCFLFFFLFLPPPAPPFFLSLFFSFLFLFRTGSCLGGWWWGGVGLFFLYYSFLALIFHPLPSLHSANAFSNTHEYRRRLLDIITFSCSVVLYFSPWRLSHWASRTICAVP